MGGGGNVGGVSRVLRSSVFAVHARQNARVLARTHTRSLAPAEPEQSTALFMCARAYGECYRAREILLMLSYLSLLLGTTCWAWLRQRGIITNFVA